MSLRWNPGWKKGKTLSLINGYIQLVQSLSSKTTADKMLSKGFHCNYFVMLNTRSALWKSGHGFPLLYLQSAVIAVPVVMSILYEIPTLDI